MLRGPAPGSPTGEAAPGVQAMPVNFGVPMKLFELRKQADSYSWTHIAEMLGGMIGEHGGYQWILPPWMNPGGLAQAMHQHGSEAKYDMMKKLRSIASLEAEKRRIRSDINKLYVKSSEHEGKQKRMFVELIETINGFMRGPEFEAPKHPAELSSEEAPAGEGAPPLTEEEQFKEDKVAALYTEDVMDMSGVERAHYVSIFPDKVAEYTAESICDAKRIVHKLNELKRTKQAKEKACADLRVLAQGVQDESLDSPLPEDIGKAAAAVADAEDALGKAMKELNREGKFVPAFDVHNIPDEKELDVVVVQELRNLRRAKDQAVSRLQELLTKANGEPWCHQCPPPQDTKKALCALTEAEAALDKAMEELKAMATGFGPAPRAEAVPGPLAEAFPAPLAVGYPADPGALAAAVPVPLRQINLLDVATGETYTWISDSQRAADSGKWNPLLPA